MPKDQTQQQETTPNLPTEDELRSHLVARHMDLAKGLYFEGTSEEWELEEAEKLADETMQLIHHYATKREVEAKVSVLELLIGWCVDGKPQFDVSGLQELVSELKAQKEQENV